MIRHPLLFRAVLAAVLAVVPVAIQAATPALDIARQLNEAFVEVSESAAKSVVVVNVLGHPERPSETYLEQIQEEQRELLEQFKEYFRGQGSGRGGRGFRGRDSEEGEGAEPKAPLVLGQGSGMAVR